MSKKEREELYKYHPDFRTELYELEEKDGLLEIVRKWKELRESLEVDVVDRSVEYDGFLES